MQEYQPPNSHMTDTKPTPLTAAQKRVADLEAKLKQARALAQKQANKARAAEQGEKRKIETRQRVLVGAFMLDGATDPAKLQNAKGQTLDQWLIRADERALFGLSVESK